MWMRAEKGAGTAIGTVTVMLCPGARPPTCAFVAVRFSTTSCVLSVTPTGRATISTGTRWPRGTETVLVEGFVIRTRITPFAVDPAASVAGNAFVCVTFEIVRSNVGTTTFTTPLCTVLLF